MVDDARLKREGCHCTGEGDEVSKEWQQSSKECADSDVCASCDEADKHTVSRPITLILSGKVCVHELIHGRCIDLYKTPQLFSFQKIQALCKQTTCAQYAIYVGKHKQFGPL